MDSPTGFPTAVKQLMSDEDVDKLLPDGMGKRVSAHHRFAGSLKNLIESANQKFKTTSQRVRLKELVLPDNIEDMTIDQMKISYKRRRSTLGKEVDAETLALAHKLADIHLTAGQYNEAEEYLRLKIETSKASKGVLHVDTLSLSRRLIEIQISQGKYRLATMTLKGSMKNHESVYGPHHSLTLDSKMMYGGCLSQHGKLGDAGQLYRGILNSLKFNEEQDESGEGLGPIFKYKVYAAYADCLIAQELYKEAEGVHVTLISLSKTVNGDKDPLTLQALKTFAWIKTQVSKQSEAEALYTEVLSLYSDVYGLRHVETLQVALPYAHLLYSAHRGIAGDPLRAVNDLYHRILNLQYDLNQDSDLSDACFQTMTRIADIQTTLGEWESAEAMLRRAQRVAEGLFGAKRPQTISTINSLASIILTQEQQKPVRQRNKERSLNALGLYRRVLVAWKVTPSLGPVHPETLQVIVTIATLLYDLDLEEDAMELLERAVVACDRSIGLGKEAPETIQMVFEAAKMYRKTGDGEKALAAVVRVLDWRSQRSKALSRVGDGHVAALRLSAEHGLVLVLLKRFDEAMPVLKSILPEFEKELGPAGGETLAVTRGYVTALLGQYGDDTESGGAGARAAAGMVQQALHLAKTCVATTLEKYGPTSPEAVDGTIVLADALVAAGKSDEAETLLTALDHGCVQEVGAGDVYAGEVSLRLCAFHSKTQNHVMVKHHSARALKIFSSAYGEDHTKTRSAEELHSAICDQAEVVTEPS